jgi:hypothetical protein
MTALTIFLVVLWVYLSLLILSVALGSKRVFKLFLGTTLLFLLFSYAYLTFILFQRLF